MNRTALGGADRLKADMELELTGVVSSISTDKRTDRDGINDQRPHTDRCSNVSGTVYRSTLAADRLQIVGMQCADRHLIAFQKDWQRARLNAMRRRHIDHPVNQSVSADYSHYA